MGGGEWKMMEALKMIPYIALVLAVSGIILGAAAIVLAEFRGTTTNVNALGAIDNASASIVTIAEQQPTVAIIGVMVIIISIISGVFVYLRYFG
jgi:hypothetical protein